MVESKTGCVCKNPGFCELHQMQKNPHYFKLCQNHNGYFTMWSQCRGPGQEFTECAKNSAKQENVELPHKKECAACDQKKIQEDFLKQEQLKQNLPSTMEQVKNLGSSLLDFAKTGFAKTEEQLSQERKVICESCPFFIQDQRRCGKCGCFVDAKIKMKSSKCPIGSW